MGFAAACFICVVLYKVISSIDCNSRKLDPRKCQCLKTRLIEWGYDEFTEFGVRVAIHSIQDIQAKGLLGSNKQFQVEVQFRWSRFTTTPTEDMRWEQTKGMG